MLNDVEYYMRLWGIEISAEDWASVKEEVEARIDLIRAGDLLEVVYLHELNERLQLDDHGL
jgi:hypothetical protein